MLNTLRCGLLRSSSLGYADHDSILVLARSNIVPLGVANRCLV